jgi:tetratricopeptide (TPR) repeat protein
VDEAVVREHPKRRAALLAALIVAATATAYTPALQAGFIWDDDDYVTENPLLPAPDGLRRIWLSMDAPSQYFPLVYTSFRIEYALWGLDPYGYHLVNVLLHAANALLVWWLLRRLSTPGAWLAAAIFALHPVHVESVAWITERKNVLSLFFFLASLLAWMRFAQPGARAKPRSYAASLAFYALALFSKTTACTLPAAQLLVLWLRGERIRLRRIAQVVPFLLLGFLAGLVAIFWERFHQGTVGDRFALSFVVSALVATRAVWFYLGKLLWPTRLTFSYPKFEIDPHDPVQYVWMVAGGALLWALWRWRPRIGRAPLAAAVFFVAMLSPMLGFIPLFTFFYTFVADHYQYTASIGPIALFAAGGAHLLERRGANARRLAGAAAALLLLALGMLTWQQAHVYANQETLWRDTITKHPGSWMAHTNLGRELLHQGRLKEAIPAYRDALAIRSDLYRPHHGIAVALMWLGRDEEAIENFEIVLQRRHNFVPTHRYYGALRWRRGEIEAAMVHYQAMIEFDPTNPRGYRLMRRALHRLGRHQEAEAYGRRARALAPEVPSAGPVD